MSVMKARTAVKLKPIAARKDEKKPMNSTVKKVPPVVGGNNQQAKNPTSNSAEYQRLIQGDFSQDFSKQTSRLFRIFLSSTFSDFKVERNELYRRVFPVIKQRCAQLGYDFQVVDMRYRSFFIATHLSFSSTDGVYPIQLIVIIQQILSVWMKLNDRLIYQLV